MELCIFKLEIYCLVVTKTWDIECSSRSLTIRVLLFNITELSEYLISFQSLQNILHTQM